MDEDVLVLEGMGSCDRHTGYRVYITAVTSRSHGYCLCGHMVIIWISNIHTYTCIYTQELTRRSGDVT